VRLNLSTLTIENCAEIANQIFDEFLENLWDTMTAPAVHYKNCQPPPDRTLMTKKNVIKLLKAPRFNLLSAKREGKTWDFWFDVFFNVENIAKHRKRQGYARMTYLQALQNSQATMSTYYWKEVYGILKDLFRTLDVIPDIQSDKFWRSSRQGGSELQVLFLFKNK
jgi:hypothetical protein